MTRIKIVAHRGYSARHPENTVASAEAAIAAGADLIEADVRFAADGALYALHDADLLRLTGRAVRVAEAGADDLAAARLDGGKVTPFAEILAAVAGRAGLLIDTKLAGEDVLAALGRALEGAGWPEDVWLGLRFPEQVAAARARFGAKVSILGFMPALEDADSFLAAGADALRIWEAELVLPEAIALKARAPVWVTAGHCRGLEVGDTDAAGLAALRAYGPDAVLLNDPSLPLNG